MSAFIPMFVVLTQEKNLEKLRARRFEYNHRGQRAKALALSNEISEREGVLFEFLNNLQYPTIGLNDEETTQADSQTSGFRA